MNTDRVFNIGIAITTALVIIASLKQLDRAAVQCYTPTTPPSLSTWHRIPCPFKQ